MLRAAIYLSILLCGTALHAQTWAEQKCAIYAKALDEGVAHFGRDGISDAFLDQNADFIAKGCTERSRICPSTPQERELADMLTVMTMNAGMASTFVPFACPQ